MYLFDVQRHPMCNKDVGEDVRKRCIRSNGVKNTRAYIYAHMCMYTVMSKENIYTHVYIYSHVQRKYVDDVLFTPFDKSNLSISLFVECLSLCRMLVSLSNGVMNTLYVCTSYVGEYIHKGIYIHTCMYNINVRIYVESCRKKKCTPVFVKRRNAYIYTHTYILYRIYMYVYSPVKRKKCRPVEISLVEWCKELFCLHLCVNIYTHVDIYIHVFRSCGVSHVA